ncbi:hypothetical protein N2152v2_000090 [Parachlorella kessleri]
MWETNWRLGRVAPAGLHPLCLPWPGPLPPSASPSAARHAHRQASRHRKLALQRAQPLAAYLSPAVEPGRTVPAQLESSAANALGSSQGRPPHHHRSYLSSLYIKDFALVAEQRVLLEPGLNVITGESGSGKSVLVEALGQILGSSAYDEAVRQPATSAVVEGSLVLGEADRGLLAAMLGVLGLPQRALPAPGAELLLRRELVKGEDGVRSRCFLNGVPTSVRVLREVGRLLVDVNGQHAALALKDSGRQLAMLDQVAGTAPAAEALAAALQRLGEVRGQLSALRELRDEEERESMQLLVDQVHAAGVEPGEDLALRQQLRQMEGRRAAAERCRLVSVGLGGSGDGGVQEAIRSVELHVKAVLHQEEKLAAADRHAEENKANGTAGAVSAEPADHDSEGAAAAMLQRALDCLNQARDLLDEAEEEVVEYARQYKFSQAEYDELYKRQQQLERLVKQHDVASADELLQLAEEKAAALDAYFQLEGQRDQLEAREAQLLAQVQQGAIALSERRRQAAGRLRAAVESLLGDLAMAGSRFDVRVSWAPAADDSSLARTNNSSGFRGSRGSGAGATASSRRDRVDSIFVDAQQAQQCWEAGDTAYRIKPSGLDAVEFLFAAGPAEPLRSLSAVASGGESARIMLALKAAPSLVHSSSSSSSSEPARAGSDASLEAVTDHRQDGSSSGSTSSSPIMILDEIDTGVGSRLGQPVGRILRSMVGGGGGSGGGGAVEAADGVAIASQILCVSHLPQVAAHAQHHICVRKGVDGSDRMVTRFESLRDPEARLQEVSAMLGLTLAAAEELMAAAQRPSGQTVPAGSSV